MNYADVRKLVKLVESSQITELEYELEGARIRVSKGPTGDMIMQAPAYAAPMPAQAPAPAAPAAAAPAAPAAPEKNYHELKSPMVGTYYAAPAPDAAPYVKVGDKVSPGQTLCIIEAMKLMNEIESDVSGTVVSVDVQNAEPVEYGAVLFKIDTQG